jgi:hypothetical protein
MSIYQELSRSATTTTEKLQFLGHFSYHMHFDTREPLLGIVVSKDPHHVGHRMGERYVHRFVRLVNVLSKSAELPNLDKRAFVRALDRAIAFKDAIGRMVKSNVDLSARPIPSPAETIDDVPSAHIPPEVRTTLELLAADHRDVAQTAKRVRAHECADEVRDAMLAIARDLVIDSHVYPMIDPGIPLALVHDVYGCWLFLHDVFVAAV